MDPREADLSSDSTEWERAETREEFRARRHRQVMRNRDTWNRRQVKQAKGFIVDAQEELDYWNQRIHAEECARLLPGQAEPVQTTTAWRADSSVTIASNAAGFAEYYLHYCKARKAQYEGLVAAQLLVPPTPPGMWRRVRHLIPELKQLETMPDIIPQ